MATVERTSRLLGEVAQLLASKASAEQVLAFRPSQEVQERFRELLHLNSKGALSRAEEYELNQYEQLEMLMQNAKARIRVAQKHAS